MARPRKKPEYDPVQMAEQLMKDVTDAYLYLPQGVADESGHMQLKALADEFSIMEIEGARHRKFFIKKI